MHPIHGILTALLLAAGLPLHAAAQQEAPDTVRLRFGWTPGMRADVEYEQVRLRNVGGEPDSTRMASTYRMEVDPHADGLSVRYADMRWTELPRMEGPMGRFMEAIGRTSGGGKPRIVVSRGGEFLRAEGMEQVAEELRQAAEPLIADMDEEGLEVFGQMIESLLSQENMAASVESEWSSLVAAWLGTDWEVHAVYETEDVVQVPMFPTVMMPVTALIQAQGETPCEGAGKGGACVRIFTSSIPEEGSLRDAVGAFMRRSGADEEEMDEFLEQLKVETYVTLITEPGTLRPWLQETTRTVSIGENAELLHQDVETYRFRWRQ